MNDAPDSGSPDPLPPNLLYLRRLVTVLTAVMILGVLTVIALLVIRLQTPPITLPLPETITLPSGVTPMAVTTGPGWYAVVTDDDRIFVYDRNTGALRQELQIEKAME